MQKAELESMDIDALMALRGGVDARLNQERERMAKALSAMGVKVIYEGRGRLHSALKGRKAEVKYRGPAGETWAGRGARPRWLTALMKEGHKINEYSVNHVAAVRKTAVTKRSRRG